MRSSFWLAAVLLSAATSAAAQATLHDDYDRTVHLRATPQRIVSLTDFLTDLVITAGGGSRLVAVNGAVDADALREPARSGAESASASELAPQPRATLHRKRGITSEALFLMPPV